ncbi:MAG: DNA-binding domain-containing protein [Rhizobiaceae bacterium]|nr:DNA-binding domain-containing protein [Rhizobiaceae bacterium]MCV0406904.1 DNA-binding domain-containing protein [Rhizobiaceae bacterium]
MPEPVISISETCRERLGYAAAFTPALLDPEIGEPEVIAGPNGKSAKKRYDVYRNNVTVSLINALSDTFPATQRIVGEEFFRAMARLHVRQSPPTSPLLSDYGRDFPDFIEDFEHARNLPYLADVARIERAWLDAYHAADAAPLHGHMLTAIPPETLGQAVFTTHPATRVVRSRFAAVTIFSVNRRNEPFGRVKAGEPEDALVTRPRLEVFVRRLPPGGARFLESLMAGEPFRKAVDAALEEDGDFDLTANISGVIEAGVFTAVMVSEHGDNG